MSSDPASTVTTAQAERDLQAESAGAGESVSPQLEAGVVVHSPDQVAQGQTAGRAVLLDEPAIEVARAAAVAEAGNPARIGEFLFAVAEDELAVSTTFAADQPGYGGWHWSVTLAVLAGQQPTVSEVVLLPGDGALLAPAWIPWDERIRPGDLGIGDLLPPIANDPRLVPAYLQSDDPAVEAVAQELGLGRVRVLSREGRVDFAERMHDGTFGPTDDMAVAAPAPCVTCGFYLPLAGSLGQLAGACGNDLSPADGRVVDAGYGCGAHSETVLVMPARSAAGDTVIDELSLEVHRRPAPALVPGVGGGSDSAAADLSPLVELAEVVEIDALLGDALDAEPTDPDLIGAPLAEELPEAEPAEASLPESPNAVASESGEARPDEAGPDAAESAGAASVEASDVLKPVVAEEAADPTGTEPGTQD